MSKYKVFKKLIRLSIISAIILTILTKYKFKNATTLGFAKFASADKNLMQKLIQLSYSQKSVTIDDF